MANMTKFQNELYEKYVKAFQTGNWDYPDKVQNDKNFVINELKAGKTFKGLWEVLQQKSCTITQQLMASPELLNVVTSGYTKAMRKGFKELMNSLGVV